MTYYCKFCDKSIKNKAKYNHSKSITHKTLDESVLRRYIVPNPIFDQIDEIMKRYIIIYNKKHEKYSLSCVLKLLTTANRVRYIRNNTKLIWTSIFSKNSILSRIDQDRYWFTHIYELRITFSSSSRDITYDYYLKKSISMCEFRLDQKLDKNPRLIYRLNRY